MRSSYEENSSCSAACNEELPVLVFESCDRDPLDFVVTADVEGPELIRKAGEKTATCDLQHGHMVLKADFR